MYKRQLDEVADVRPAEVKVSVNVPVPVIARSLNDAVPLLSLIHISEPTRPY